MNIVINLFVIILDTLWLIIMVNKNQYIFRDSAIANNKYIF